MQANIILPSILMEELHPAMNCHHSFQLLMVLSQKTSSLINFKEKRKSCEIHAVDVILAAGEN